MGYEPVLVVLATLLVVGIFSLCVYAIVVLKDLRVTIAKANELIDQTKETEQKASVILEDLQSVSHAIANPYTSVSSLIGGVVGAFKAMKSNDTKAIGSGD